MVILRDGLRETFEDLISQSMDNQQLVLSDGAETYVIEVCCEFAFSEGVVPNNVFKLTDLLRYGLNSDGLIRREYLRITGDLALFVSGIFPDILESRRTAFNISDYIDIGRSAYENIHNEVFSELSWKFPEIVDMLNSVSIQIDLSSVSLERYLKRRGFIDARITRR